MLGCFQRRSAKIQQYFCCMFIVSKKKNRNIYFFLIINYTNIWYVAAGSGMERGSNTSEQHSDDVSMTCSLDWSISGSSNSLNQPPPRLPVNFLPPPSIKLIHSFCLVLNRKRANTLLQRYTPLYLYKCNVLASKIRTADRCLQRATTSNGYAYTPTTLWPSNQK